MTVTFRYVGTQPTTFSDQRIGQVEPGDEFGVLDEEATGYEARADLVIIADTRPDEAPEDAPQDEPEPEAPEAPEAVSAPPAASEDPTEPTA